MTERFAAVLALEGETPGAPPGIDPEPFRLALLEDTYEVAAEMGQVTAALAMAFACPSDQPRVEAVTWPGTPLLRLPVTGHGTGASEDLDDGAEHRAEPGGGVPHSARVLISALSGLAELGADEGAVLVGDAPDLPVMLLGKLFQGLEYGQVAACAAEGGGLVALASRLPAPEWLAGAQAGLDTSDALARLHAAAPARRALSVTPGWRRIRRPVDVANLDPGLEGWEATRALLSGRGLA